MISSNSLLRNQTAHFTLLFSPNLAKKYSHAGFSYIEVLMAVVILALALIPLLSQFYVGFQGNRNAEIVTQAADLAADLMEEIKTRRFDENAFPDAPVSPSAFGTDFGEDPNNRSTFDDVDDYNNWSKKPPQTIDSIVLTDFKDFTRKVKVQYVQVSNNIWVTSGSATNYKRVTVTVSHPQINDKTLETIISNY